MTVLNRLMMLGGALIVICLIVLASQSSGRSPWSVPAFDIGVALLALGGVGRLVVRVMREERSREGGSSR